MNLSSLLLLAAPLPAALCVSLAAVSCAYHTARERHIHTGAPTRYTLERLYTADKLNITLALWCTAFGSENEALMPAIVATDLVTGGRLQSLLWPVCAVVLALRASLADLLLAAVTAWAFATGASRSMDDMRPWPEWKKIIWHGGAAALCARLSAPA